MSTDLITVHPDEPIKLVRNILLWSNIRHIPVESADGQLLGMISTEKLWERGDSGEALENISAADVMERHPPTVTPDTPIADALRLMTTTNLTCLAVLVNQKLVGVLTERDCLKIARGMLRDASDIAHGK